MLRHRIPLVYKGPGCDEAVELAFSKKQVEARKTWLTSFMEVCLEHGGFRLTITHPHVFQIRRERRNAGQIEDYLYNKETREISFADFINKELVLFSNADNERSIPSLVDGLKPGQRKVRPCLLSRVSYRA